MKRQKPNAIFAKSATWLKSVLLAASIVTVLPGANAHSGSSCTCPAGPDRIPPIARCKTGAELDVSCTPTTLPVSVIDNGSCDNSGGSGIASITVSPNSFTCSDAGYKTVVLTVQDKAGNIARCTTTVHIECYQPTCNITVSPCTTNVIGGSTTLSAPNVITLGYGPQCVVLHGNVSGANAYYTYCWSESTSNPALGTLSCGSLYTSITCPDPVFTPTKAGNYTFTLTTYGFPNSTNTGCIPNASLCSTTCTVTICVRDANHDDDDDDDANNCSYDRNEDYGYNNSSNSGKKVYLCHVPPGNPANAHTIYISVNAVSAHLRNHPGDKVGMCNEQCGNVKKKKKDKKDKHNNYRQNNSQVITDGDLQFVLYPNPSTKDFHITVESSDASNADIVVYDLAGRAIEKHTALPVGADVAVGKDLAPGIYMIQVTHGGQSKMVKVTKQ